MASQCKLLIFAFNYFTIKRQDKLFDSVDEILSFKIGYVQI